MRATPRALHGALPRECRQREDVGALADPRRRGPPPGSRPVGANRGSGRLASVAVRGRPAGQPCQTSAGGDTSSGPGRAYNSKRARETGVANSVDIGSPVPTRRQESRRTDPNVWVVSTSGPGLAPSSASPRLTAGHIAVTIRRDPPALVLSVGDPAQQRPAFVKEPQRGASVNRSLAACPELPGHHIERPQGPS